MNYRRRWHKRKVLDRTALILDIFAKHAHTSEACCRWKAGRMNTLFTAPDRTIGPIWNGRLAAAVDAPVRTGGVGLRGPGETQLEVDKRAIRKRISISKPSWKDWRLIRGRYRAQRKRSRIPTLPWWIH